MHGLHVSRRISTWPASGPQRRRSQAATSPRSRGAWGEAPHPPDPLTCLSASGPAGLCPDPPGLGPPRSWAAPGSGYARPCGPPSAALRSGPRVPPSAPPRVLASHGGAGVAGLSGCASPIVAPVSAGARGGTSGTGDRFRQGETRAPLVPDGCQDGSLSTRQVCCRAAAKRTGSKFTHGAQQTNVLRHRNVHAPALHLRSVWLDAPRARRGAALHYGRVMLRIRHV